MWILSKRLEIVNSLKSHRESLWQWKLYHGIGKIFCLNFMLMCMALPLNRLSSPPVINQQMNSGSITNNIKHFVKCIRLQPIKGYKENWDSLRGYKGLELLSSISYHSSGTYLLWKSSGETHPPLYSLLPPQIWHLPLCVFVTFPGHCKSFTHPQIFLPLPETYGRAPLSF